MVDRTKEIKDLEAKYAEIHASIATHLEQTDEDAKAKKWKTDALLKYGLYESVESELGWTEFTTRSISPEKFMQIKERIAQTAMSAKKREWANALLDSLV